MTVKFCGECGHPLEPESQFCGECGWKVPKQDETEASTVEQPAEQPLQQPVQPPIKEPPASSMNQTDQKPWQPQQREHNPFKSFSQAVNQGTQHQWKGEGSGGQTRADPHPSAKDTAAPPPSASPVTMSPQPSASNPRHPGAIRQKTSVHPGNQGAMRGAPGSVKKKPIALIVGGILLILILAAGAMFFLGDRNNPGETGSAASSGLFSGGISPESLDGNWFSDFTPLSVTLNDEVVPEYNVMIGRTTSTQMNLSMNSDGTGSASFQGSSYGYEFSSEAEVILNNNQLLVRYHDPETGYQLEYTGTVANDGDGYFVTGTYETVMAESGVIPGELRVKGSWESYTVQARVGEELNTTGAKTDTTLADLQGEWSGSLVFDDFVIRNAPPGSEEEVQAFQEEVIGKESTCTLHFQDDTFFMTFVFPDGTEDVLDEFPPITLENGVFSVASASSPNDRDNFRIDVYGVVKDTGMQMIEGGFTFIAAEGGSDFEMKASFQVTK